jgi:hypothetical protein
VILAEDLERLVVRRASLVNEFADALLPDYQFFPLLKRRLKQFPAYLNRWDSQQARNEGVFAH